MKLSFAFGVVAAIYTFAAAQDYPPGPVEKIVLTGDPMLAFGPDYQFVTYSSRGPCINNQGEVAFFGVFNGPNVTSDDRYGVFLAHNDAIDLIIRARSQAPGAAPDVLFDGLEDGAINLGDDGQLAISARLRGPGITSTNNFAVLAGQRANVTMVAQKGSPTPGVPRTWQYLEATTCINAAGQILIHDANAGLAQGLWMGPPNALAPLAVSRLGSVPGFPERSEFVNLNVTPVMSETRTAAFVASFSYSPAGDSSGVFAGTPDALTALLVRNQPFPGIPGKVAYTFGRPAISPTGQVAFTATYQHDGFVYASVLTEGKLGLRRVFGGDITLPGAPPDTYPYLVPALNINTSGSLLFRVAMRVASSTVFTGTWMEANNQLSLIFVDRLQLPELPDGVILRSNQDYAFNARNQVAFRGALQGPGVTSGANSQVLMTWDSSQGLIIVARQGELFTLSPGDTRVVESIDFALGFGAERLLNDEGQLVFGMKFADGAAGIFTYQLPPPQGLCPADLNADSFVDFTDYLEFLNLYDALDPRADFNDDGFIDFSDYLEFLNHYDAGC